MRPTRETATNNGQTYFVTSNTAERKPFFQHERWAGLFVETLYSYRPERYAMHGFTVMPDHFHCLITPTASLELAVQCLKGGFSFRAKKEFAWKGEVWVAGFSDHRIRDTEDFEVHERYIARNAVKAGLVDGAEEYPYCSANGKFELDAFPRGLKPLVVAETDGGAEAPPFQDKGILQPFEDKGILRPFQDEGLLQPFQDKGILQPFQDKSLLQVRGEDKMEGREK